MRSTQTLVKIFNKYVHKIKIMWHQRIHKQIFVFDLKANGETSKQINRAIKLCVIVNMFFECYIHYLISLISHNKIYTFLSRKKKIILSLVVSFWLSFLGVMKSSTLIATTCTFLLSLPILLQCVDGWRPNARKGQPSMLMSAVNPLLALQVGR